MKTKWWTQILIFSLAMNAAVLGVCGYHYYRYARDASSANCPLYQRDDHLYQRLGLSDSQLKKMAPLSHSFHARLDQLRREGEEKRAVLMDLLSGKVVDPERIEELRKDMAGIQERIQQAVVSHLLDMRHILTTEQRERFFTLLRGSLKQGNNWISKQGG